MQSPLLKNIILQYPRLPLIEVRTAGGKGPRYYPTSHLHERNCGLTTCDQRYFPIELCNIIPNQRFSGRVNEDETTALVQFASTAPPQKEHSLQQIHGKMRFSRAQNPYLDAYGADVRTQMVTIQARKLQDPEMLYFGKSGNPVVTGPANKGWVWRSRAERDRLLILRLPDSFWNMPNNAVFVQPGQLKGLSIAVFADNRALSMNNDPFAACTNIQAFVAELLRVSDDLGLRMERDVTIPEPRYLDPNVSNDSDASASRVG